MRSALQAGGRAIYKGHRRAGERARERGEIMTYILFVAGFIILVKGGDFLVMGSSSIAKRFGLSDLIVGLTIVSFGTSAPELVVNVISSV